MHYRFVLLLLGTFTFVACKNNKIINQNNPPIILGDSATIVTETDSQFLKNDIAEYEVANTPTPTVDTVIADASQSDTSKSETNTAASSTSTAKGFTIDLDGGKLILDNVKEPAITVKNGYYSIKQNDFPKAVGFEQMKSIQMKQRYVSKIAVKTSQGTLDVGNAGWYTSPWESVKISGSSASIPSLEKLQFQAFKTNKLQTFFKEAINKSNKSSSAKKKMLSEVKNIQSINDKSILITPLKVEWQISGQNNKGKSIQKNLSFSL